MTQSGQLYAEVGAMAFGKCYVFGPTFRAEKSKTRKHLTEFWMVEPEMAYADLNDSMDLGEGLVEFVFQNTLEKNQEELLDEISKKLDVICRLLAISLPETINQDQKIKILSDLGSRSKASPRREWRRGQTRWQYRSEVERSWSTAGTAPGVPRTR